MATRDLQVGITDVNDNDPVFAQEHYTGVTVTEGATSTNIITFTTSDADSTFTAAYAISSGNSGGFFAFNGGTPNQLDVSSAIDLDSPTSDPAEYILVVTVADGHVTERTGTATVFITVTPSDDHNPTFDSTSPGSISVSLCILLCLFQCFIV